MLFADRKKLSILRLAELSALALVAFALSPYGFVIYFCGFHSPRHLIAEFRAMKKETRFIAYRDVVVDDSDHVSRVGSHIENIMNQLIWSISGDFYWIGCFDCTSYVFTRMGREATS